MVFHSRTAEIAEQRRREQAKKQGFQLQQKLGFGEGKEGKPYKPYSYNGKFNEGYFSGWTEGRARWLKSQRQDSPAIVRARRLLADDVSLERAYAEIKRPDGLAESTKKTVDWLAHHGAAGELKRFVAKHPQREALEAYGAQCGKTQA